MDSLPEDSDAPATLPSVVAIVVAHDPGEWFETTMASLAAQDYDQLAVLVIDAASTIPVRDRVAAVFPSALVRRIDHNPGYGAATDEAVAMVQGAPFLLLCHDDIELAPNSVRVLVEEAYRSNAGVVGPKLVRWDAPREILQLGLVVDKTGYASPRVEVGEFDQEQHDSVRDVFALPSACLLVRSDLYRAIGGFDETIDYLGDDVDLCWRAQVAGARVVIAPEARVCHLEALGDRRRVDDRRRLQARHRLRTTLVCYAWLHLLRVLPQAALLAFGEIVYALLVGRGRQARDIAGAWWWNLRRVGSLYRARRALSKVRQVPDSDVRPLQSSGYGRINALARGQIGRTGDDRLTSVGTAGRDLANFFRQGPSRASAVVWIAITVFLVVGSRHLITRSIPAIGQFAEFPGSPVDLVRAWASGWSSAGLGSTSPNPTGFGVLGAAGFLFLGAMGVLRTVVILAMLPLGAFGAWRLLAPTRSRWSKLVALIVYVAVPVAYNAIALGHWAGLVLYGAAPWLLARLARASSLPPYSALDRPVPTGDDDVEPPSEGISPRTRRQHVLALGVMLALVSCLVPLAVPVVLIMAVGLVLGGLLGGSTAAAGRILGVAVGASIVAAILQLPWVLDFLPPRFQWSAVGAEATSSTSGLDPLHLLRFESGPLGAGLFGFAFLVVAALPLLLARGWRLGWAIRGWALALTCWGVLLAAEAGWLPYGPSASEILLAPAAAGLALAAGLGVTAFERDLSTSFSWRQIVSFVALGSLVLAVLPAFGAMFNGRWFAPRGDFSSSLSFLDEEVEEAPFRVLWLGDPDVMPLAGWELEDDVVYATTDHGEPDVTNVWAGSSRGATALLGDALDAAGSRQTNRLGRVLAPMGVQYIIVVEQLAPAPFSEEKRPVPAHLTNTLDEQLDLEAIDVNPALNVYRNIAWAPSRTFLPDGEVGTGDREALEQAVGVDLSGLPVALPDEVHLNRYEGPVDTGDRVYLSAAASDGWHLRSGGETASRSEAFGWANAFAVGAAGDATLRYETSPTRYLLLGLQVGLWAIVLFALFRGQVGPRGPSEGVLVKPHRWPALLVIPAVLIGGVVLERSRDDGAPAEGAADATRTLEEQGLMPVSAPASALGATWYCAGGAVGGDDDANHSVIIANPGDQDLSGTVTVYGDADSAGPVTPEPTTPITAPPDDEGDEGDEGEATTTTTSTTTTTLPPTTTTTLPPIPPASVPYEVPAASSIEVDLGEIDGVQPGFTAALVEADGGEAVVEHRVGDDNGTDVSPCSPFASPTWYFAAGATTQDAVETLVFFNPFPDAAVVDVTFRTDQDLRTPEAFEGVVIPGQSVVARDVGEVVTRREHVSASVVARSGRLVVDRLQSFDGSEGPQGVTVSLGAPVPAETWFFPEGLVGEGVDEQVVVFNPTEERAEVDLEITVDDPERNGEIEPFELTIPPEGYETILLNEEARITSARGGEGALAHATVVRSVNGVPVVAERQSIGGPDSDFPGYDLVLGAPLLADEFVLAAGADSDGGEALMIFNPVSAEDAEVTVSAVEDGELVPVDGLESLTVEGGRRLAVVVEGVPDNAALVVTADHPVVVERRLVFEDDVSSAIGVPTAGSLTEP